MTAEKEYGTALYDLAVKEGVCDIVKQDLSVAVQAFAQNPQYVALVQAPSLKKAERLALLDTALQGAHPYVVNFVKILCEKNSLSMLGACANEFCVRYNEDNGILEVTVCSAVPLSDAQTQALCKKLADITGKTIQLTNKVDPTVLGGLRLSYAGKQIDGSVAQRLASLRTALLA